MKHCFYNIIILILLYIYAPFVLSEEYYMPSVDARLKPGQTRITPVPMKVYSSRDEWLGRKQYLKNHMFVSLGLWPMPERTDLKANVFGKIDRGDYSVEKVYFQSRPGIYVVGNLYKPLGKEGPFPAILCPHGHWKKGRLNNDNNVSVPGRCINLAKQGYVVFSHSMVGYNELKEAPIKHLDDSFSTDQKELWAISLIHIQTYNSIRALDFLCSLPEVDGDRIGITGASGGGTQTFILSAIEDRVSVSVPVNMICLNYQGGGSCQNAPGLRVGTNNLEFSAMVAPRPQLLITATGDCGKTMPDIGCPMIRNVYQLLDVPNNFSNFHLDAGHNYNKQSREAAYAWFAQWLYPDKTINTQEISFKVEKDEDLLVFDVLPEDALKTEGDVVEFLIDSAKRDIQQRIPQNRDELECFRSLFGFAFKDMIGAESPCNEDLASFTVEQTESVTRYYIGRKGCGDRIPFVLLYPKTVATQKVVLLVDNKGFNEQLDGLFPRLGSLTEKLLANGNIVGIVQPFPAGEKVEYSKKIQRPDRYNRMPDAYAIQDILTAATYLRRVSGFDTVNLIGLNDAGVKVICAAALSELFNIIIADVNGFDTDNDQSFIDKLNIHPICRAGDFTTAAALITPRRLVIHNMGEYFDTTRIRTIYQSADASGMLDVFREKLPAKQVMGLLNTLSFRKD